MNEAIKLAIEKGGWLPQNYTWFITNPIEAHIGGERIILKGAPHDGWDGGTAYLPIKDLDKCRITQDPLFWQALGKALGNKDEMICDSPKCESRLCEYAGYKDPKRMYDQYHELIWYGGDTEKFWKELIN